MTNTILKKRKVFIFVILFLLFNGILFSLFQPSVKITLRGQEDTLLHFFYDNLSEDYPFDDSHMATFDYNSKNGIEAIVVKVPLKNLNKLRIDFGTVPTSFEIYSFSILKSPIYEIAFSNEEFKKRFSNLNDIDNLKIVDQYIDVVTTGEDGHIYSENLLFGTAPSFRIDFLVKEFFLIICTLLLVNLAIIINLLKPLLFSIKKINKKLICHPLSKKDRILGLLLVLTYSFILAFFTDVVVFRLIAKTANLFGFDTLYRYFSKSLFFSLDRVYFIFIFVFAIGIVIYLGIRKAVRYRYGIAFLFLLLMVIGKFTGSSLGFYDGMLQGNTANYHESTLLGIPQGIRGDEWATEKPYYFAQIMGDNELPYFNKNLSFDGNDMVVSAFAPVKDITILARPDLWGFLFLPGEYAFSFYWCFRLILLFMASFEMGYLLTKRYRYAILAAFIICFAPPVQWWLSQTLMLMLMSGQFAVVLFDKYLRAEKKHIKISCLLGIGFFALVYTLTMYPATQVPLAYIFLAIIIYLSIKNKEYRPFSLKRIFHYSLALIPFFAIIVRFFVKSSDALHTIMNTTYPGSTRPWIKLPWDYELYQFVNPFTAIIRHPDFLNASEISQFYSLTPFVIIITILIVKNKKLLLPILLLFTSVGLWLMAWMPYNSLLNKITLMSFTYPIRITYAYGFGFTLLIISLLPLLEKKAKGVLSTKAASIITGTIFFFTLCVLTNSNNVFEYYKSFKFGTVLMILLVALLSYIGFLLLTGGRNRTRRLAILLVLISIGSTLMVNPITQGTDSMFEKTTMAKIREIDGKDKGRWMVSGSPTISNLVTAQGVARTTGTYYYPDWAMMETIDKDHKYVNLWNQFAHIDMRLTDGPLEVLLLDRERSQKVDGTNRIIYIPIETAKELNVKYIFTIIPIPQSIIDKGEVTLLYKDKIDPWSIYQINY